MKLGGSLQRRRSGRKDRRPGGGAGGGGGRLEALRRGLRLAGLALLLGLLGFGIGWLVATRMLFPPVEPPPDLVEVPDLLGAELDEARSRVREAGLVWGDVDSLRHPTVASGLVLGQTPLPGQLALPDSAVYVTVSLGPQTRDVPRVAGLRGDEVTAILEATGFEVEVDTVESELPRGRVVELDPSPGTPLVLPGVVRIRVSEGPAQVEMPYLLGMAHDEAEALLDSLGLVVAEVEERSRPGREGRRVIEQEPASGTLVESGSAVRLVVGPDGRLNRNIPPSAPYDPTPSKTKVPPGVRSVPDVGLGWIARRPPP